MIAECGKCQYSLTCFVGAYDYTTVCPHCRTAHPDLQVTRDMPRVPCLPRTEHNPHWAGYVQTWWHLTVSRYKYPGSPQAREAPMTNACNQWLMVPDHISPETRNVAIELCVDCRRDPTVHAKIKEAACDD